MEHGTTLAQTYSVADYQERVPITAYDALAPPLAAIERGDETGVLTADPVKRFQPTSGSIVGKQTDPLDRHRLAGNFGEALLPGWLRFTVE